MRAEIPVPEPMVNAMGYRALGADEIEEAIAIFEEVRRVFEQELGEVTDILNSIALVNSAELNVAP